jgi:AraC-like DNA-binding protein
MKKYKYEKIIAGPGKSFKTYDEVGATIESDFHVHPEYELTYIASSSGIRFIGDSIASFSPGDLALIGPMVPHHYRNPPHESVSDRWGHARIVQFGSKPDGIAIFEISEFKIIKRMLEDSLFGIEFPSETVQFVKSGFERLFSAEGPARMILFLKILERLAVSKYKKLSVSVNQAEKIKPDSRINSVLGKVHEILDSGGCVTLKAVAREAAMSPQAFSRYFRKTTFKRFIDYVNEVKTGKACRLLIDTDKSISEICYESGFGNLSNFNRHFKKIKGITPKVFRKSFNPE